MQRLQQTIAQQTNHLDLLLANIMARLEAGPDAQDVFEAAMGIRAYLLEAVRSTDVSYLIMAIRAVDRLANMSGPDAVGRHLARECRSDLLDVVRTWGRPTIAITEVDRRYQANVGGSGILVSITWPPDFDGLLVTTADGGQLDVDLVAARVDAWGLDEGATDALVYNIVESLTAGLPSPSTLGTFRIAFHSARRAQGDA